MSAELSFPMETREQEQKNEKASGKLKGSENGCIGDVETRRREIVLTAPLKPEWSPDVEDYRAPNVLKRVLALIKTLRPGTDLTRCQIPPIFNFPKSMIQCFGEAVYCVSRDLLSQCANGTSPIDRFLSVVAWNISTIRPMLFGVGPYNPILGETHHVSRGTLNVLVEQVSHHPSVAAIHVTDANGIEIIGCHPMAPKYHGASVDIMVRGQRQMRLLNKGEKYVMEHPNMVVRFLPIPGVHWLGNITISCQETGLEAELCYGEDYFYRKNSHHRSVTGTIFQSSSRRAIYNISGNWDRAVTVKDLSNGKLTVIYDAKDCLSGLKTPILKEPEMLLPSESVVVWAEVSKCIMSKSWDQAKEAKTVVEERERELARQRKARGETWVPKHFTVSQSKESGWDCFPKQKWVPTGPIIVPA